MRRFCLQQVKLSMKDFSPNLKRNAILISLVSQTYANFTHCLQNRRLSAVTCGESPILKEKLCSRLAPYPVASHRACARYRIQSQVLGSIWQAFSFVFSFRRVSRLDFASRFRRFSSSESKIKEGRGVGRPFMSKATNVK